MTTRQLPALAAAQADGRACVICAHDLPTASGATAPRVDVGQSAETGSVVFACGMCADLAATGPDAPIPLVPTAAPGAPGVNH